MFLQLTICFLATLVLFIGLFLKGFIIYYLKSKDDLHKTGFDKVLIDSIWSLIFLGSMIFLSLVLVCISPQLPQVLVIVLAMVRSFSHLNFATSALVTIATKLCYLKQHAVMLETSDKKIYRFSRNIRVILLASVYYFNYLKPYVNELPIECTILLRKPYEYQW